MNRSLASALLVAVAAASLGACSITRPSPVKEMYLLEPPPVQALAQSSPLSVRIGTVTVAAPYRDRTFVVREADLRFENDYYHEYVVAPAPMIAEAMARALAQSKAFAKVMLEPGEVRSVKLALDMRAFAAYDDTKAAWWAEAGAFDIGVGASSLELPLRARVTLVADWLEAVGH